MMELTGTPQELIDSSILAVICTVSEPLLNIRNAALHLEVLAFLGRTDPASDLYSLWQDQASALPSFKGLPLRHLPTLRHTPLYHKFLLDNIRTVPLSALLQAIAN